MHGHIKKRCQSVVQQQQILSVHDLCPEQPPVQWLPRIFSWGRSYDMWRENSAPLHVLLFT
jgi:hypothetical protein